MTESPRDADIIADGRVFALNCEYAHGRCTRLDFSPGNLVAFARALLAAKQPEPPPCLSMQDAQLIANTHRVSLPVVRSIEAALGRDPSVAAPPAGPMREPEFRLVPRPGEPGHNEIEWAAFRAAWDAALAAVPQPSPEGGEAEREANALLDKAEADLRDLNAWDHGLYQVPAAGVKELILNLRAALSRKETPHG